MTPKDGSHSACKPCVLVLTCPAAPREIANSAALALGTSLLWFANSRSTTASPNSGNSLVRTESPSMLTLHYIPYGLSQVFKLSELRSVRCAGMCQLDGMQGSRAGRV